MMAEPVGRLLKMTNVQVCCRFLTWLLSHLGIAGVAAVTTPSGHSNRGDNQDDEQEEADRAKGLAAGFGFVCGLILLVCVMWRLCCAGVCSGKDSPPRPQLKAKVSPSVTPSTCRRPRPVATSSP